VVRVLVDSFGLTHPGLAASIRHEQAAEKTAVNVILSPAPTKNLDAPDINTL
jgi:hypothetical protein